MRRSWAVLAAGLLLAVYVLTAGSRPSVDVASADLQAWRIATTGSPWLDGLEFDPATDPDLAFDFEDLPYSNFWTGENPSGHLVVYRSPGVTAVSVPAYLLSGSEPEDFSATPAAVLAALLTWCSVLMMWGAVRRRAGDRTAFVASGLLALATPVWSVAADGMWPHTLTLFGISGLAWSASRDRWLAAGVFGGIALTGRLHASLVVGITGLLVGLARRDVRPTLRAAATSVPFLVLAAAWSRWLYGQWDPAGGYPQMDAYAQQATSNTLTDTLVNEVGLWISPERGFLVWTPVVVLLLPALARSWRAQPDWARALLVSGLCYTLVQGMMNGFTGGWTFWGFRLTMALLACSFPALTFCWSFTGRTARACFPVVAGLQAGAIALGAILDLAGLQPDQAWSRNSFVVAVVEVPALIPLWMLCGLAGVLVARLLDRQSPDKAPAPISVS